jgi:antitoxin component YwqK of YwqJK toxin-antitoxin module
MIKSRYTILLPFLVLMLFMGITRVMGQNQLDDQGRKTGPWKVDYPNGKTLYEAEFLEGRPVGLMIRYYENGAVRARMNFDSDADRSYAKLYYQGGKPAAEGWYSGKLKDSIWTYYSEIDGSVRIREPYQAGKLQGKVLSYYPDGTVSEGISWVENSREGPWKQYYENGALRLECTYENDLLNGLYRVYNPDSTLRVSGNYSENLSHGVWSYYNDDGDELYTIEFEAGRAVDQQKYMELLQDSLSRVYPVETPDVPQHF